MHTAIYNASQTMIENNKSQENSNASPPKSVFSEFIHKLVMNAPFSKSNIKVNNTSSTHLEKRQQDRPGDPTLGIPAKRTCRAPLSKRFAHPCTCNQSNHHKSNQNNVVQNNNSSLPQVAFSQPLHLYDPASRKCLPTSRLRDMLLRECRSSVAGPYPLPHPSSHQTNHVNPCFYDDLVCDARRNRCICKPSLHLFYETNLTAFGCIPLGPNQSPDGKIQCRSGQIFNMHSKECQKIFDISDLPPTYANGVSATQFSFVTIVLIWILLLILLVTAKLRKLRSTNMYRNSPTSERRLNRGGSYRNPSHNGASAWLHPLFAAVNGHQHLNQGRINADRHANSIDETGNYNDTDFFLTNGGRRLNDLIGPDGHYTGSQLSINNPPPKFEEIYPVPRTEERLANQLPQPSNEDLPTYDEAMKLQNTIPIEITHKE